MQSMKEQLTVNPSEQPADGWSNRVDDLLAFADYFEAAMVCDCLAALARLRIPEALATEPLTAEQLADVVRADAGALRQAVALALGLDPLGDVADGR